MVFRRNAHAVISPRKNAQPWKPTSGVAIARNDAVKALRYLGRFLRRRWSGYHRRSRVETKPIGIMLCTTPPVSGCIVSMLMDQSLMTRAFDRQIAEIKIWIAVLNRYTALGIAVTEPVG